MELLAAIAGVLFVAAVVGVLKTIDALSARAHRKARGK